MPDSSPPKALRTLIVDDEPLALERMELICRDLAMIEVAGTAQDGAAALRAIGALAPDLVLLDMTMPELDGLAVARALTRQDDAPAVIFVTAHDNFAVEAFALAVAGVHQHERVGVAQAVGPRVVDEGLGAVSGVVCGVFVHGLVRA